MDELEAEIARTMEQLRPLIGEWEGSGSGGYPTIDDFRYTEHLAFVSNDVEPLLRLEQRTWTSAVGETDGEPLHWEVGFLRPVGPGQVEWSSTQNGVRVEVLAGPLTVTDIGLEMELDSVVLAHDDRLVRTRRVITLVEDELRYLVEMVTTKNESMSRHLIASLRRKA